MSIWANCHCTSCLSAKTDLFVIKNPPNGTNIWHLNMLSSYYSIGCSSSDFILGSLLNILIFSLWLLKISMYQLWIRADSSTSKSSCWSIKTTRIYKQREWRYCQLLAGYQIEWELSLLLLWVSSCSISPLWFIISPLSKLSNEINDFNIISEIKTVF